VSSGTSKDLYCYRAPYQYTPQFGWHPTTIRAIAIGPGDRVYAWHSATPTSDVDTAGPVLVGAYLDPPAVQPGGNARVIVRAHRPDGTPLAGSIFFQAEAGLFHASSAAQVTGWTNAAGFFATGWRAPDSSQFTRDETYISAVVSDPRGHSGHVRVKVPILRQRLR